LQQAETESKALLSSVMQNRLTLFSSAAYLALSIMALQKSLDVQTAAVTWRLNLPIQELEHRLDRRLEQAERARIGVTQLRRFLEQLLQRRWVDLHRNPAP
jgi:hypothetical protein